jgi:hypothetical protein
MRHWSTIASTLYRVDVYVPLLLLGEKGMAHGNDWARGFMCGIAHAPRWLGRGQSQTPFHNPFHIRRKWRDLQRLVAAPMVSKSLSFRTYKR